MRLIEAHFPQSCADAVADAVKNCEPVHWTQYTSEHDGQIVFRAFFAGGGQDLVDALQDICENEDEWRILVLPVEATAPKIEDSENGDQTEQRKQTALREEIYDDVARGAELDVNFFTLTIASTIVAAIGLNADSVAAVIGAMVIAPLLGPILATTFGATLGDRKMILRAARNAVIGLGVGIGGAALIGGLLGVNLESHELMARIVVGIDSIALALAAGVAAALSVTTGVSAALVGVMVAAALLPPAAAIGLFLGAGEFMFAARAGLLLAVNVICIMLASQGVYFIKGIRPRTWLEQKSAKNAMLINLISLGVLLALAAVIIVLAPTDVIPEVSSGD